MTEKFSASQASKFMKCHASANLDIAIPGWVPPEKDENADNAANRGTILHGLLAGVMGLSAKDVSQVARALLYVSEIRSHRRFKVLVEETVEVGWLPSLPKTTADLVLYLQDELHVFDWKTGKIRVDVKDNDQMMFYAASYLQYAPKAKFVTLHIVQPWADNIEAQVVHVDDLYKWMAHAINHDVSISTKDTTFVPGDHCMFCPANPHTRGARGTPLCPVMMEMLYPGRLVSDDAVFAAAEED